MTAVVTGSDIERAIAALGLRGESVVAHASLKSFGQVDGGADAVAVAFTKSFRTLLMPAFNWGEGSALAAPPPGEVLEHNGVDEGFLASLPPAPRPFDRALTPIHAAMGAVPRALHALPATVRSEHPVASWLAHGVDAALILDDQPWDDPHLPLRRLCDLSGWLLLCGVDLRACTALHVAEEHAGRRGFVRWAVRADGSIGRVRVGGCSDGFEALWPRLRDVFRTEQVGGARLAAAPLVALVERATEVFLGEPWLSVCSASCVRCRDAQAG